MLTDSLCVRAIRYDGARLHLDSRADEPNPGPGEAVIRPLRMGVSAFDAALAVPATQDSGLGPRDSAPITLGHEFVGLVEKLHEDADRDLRKRWEGKRVVGSIDIVCARCDMCRAGLGGHCRARRILGRSGWDGCFADRFKLPLRNLAEVPREVHDVEAVVAQPLAAAAHIAQLLRVEGKPYVTVLGDGVGALLCAQVLVRLNASVRLLGAQAGKFSLCERWGIKHRHVSEVGRRADQDIVVDATDSGAGLDLALRLVRPRGKIVLAGVPRAAGSSAGAWFESIPAIVEHEIELLGSRGGNPADALPALARAEIDVLPLITRRCRLSDGAAALAAASAPDQIKVLIEP